MKQKTFVLFLITVVITACNLPSPVTPVVATATPMVIPTSTFDTGGVVTLNNVSFTLPLGVAGDAQTEMVAAATDPNSTSPWDLAPAYLKFTLTGYQQQDKFLPPQVFVYPADEYAKTNPAAAEQIQRLKNILAGSALSKDTIPVLPFANASQQIASQIQLIDFKTGRGVRLVTQYAQYAAPINNHELFYHFQGITNEGKYYIVATFPVSSSILAEDEKPESPVPAGGVPFPQSTGPDPAYYEAVTQALDAMYPDSFNPSLFQLDALIQSITVTPE
jgi:hypothetical protein